MLDLKIRNGVMIDGANTPRYQADLGIQGDCIIDSDNLAETEAQVTIDAAGHMIAPGVVDVHNHADAWLLKTPHLISKTSQGFTTEFIMADSISYASVNGQIVVPLRSNNRDLFDSTSQNGLSLEQCRIFMRRQSFLTRP